MCWFVLTHLVAFLVDLVCVRRRPDRDKDLQILLLQHQVRLLQRQRPQPRLTRWEQLTFAVLTSTLARLTAGPRTGLERAVLLFKPDTVLKWHRELIRRKWTVRRRNRGGRPAIAAWRGRTPAGATASSRACMVWVHRHPGLFSYIVTRPQHC